MEDLAGGPQHPASFEGWGGYLGLTWLLRIVYGQYKRFNFGKIVTKCLGLKKIETRNTSTPVSNTLVDGTHSDPFANKLQALESFSAFGDCLNLATFLEYSTCSTSVSWSADLAKAYEDSDPYAQPNRYTHEVSSDQLGEFLSEVTGRVLGKGCLIDGKCSSFNDFDFLGCLDSNYVLLNSIYYCFIPVFTKFGKCSCSQIIFFLHIWKLIELSRHMMQKTSCGVKMRW